MTAAAADCAPRAPAAGPYLVAGIVCAALTEAIASTVVSLGRADIAGTTHATPDEMAWLDMGYTALKLVGFMLAPWLLTRINPRTLIVGSTLAMGAAGFLAAHASRLDLLVALRVVQGLAGGMLLVGGQAVLFLAFARRHQPIIQTLFATGSVVAPATLTPALAGWLLDRLSWTWIFHSIVPLALAGAGLLMLAHVPVPRDIARRPFDWIGILLVATTLFCLTYVLSQGARWNWFEEARIVWLTLIGVGAALAFLGQQALSRRGVLLDFQLFRSKDFSFALAVSLVAGAALFGTAFLIPAFAVSVLAFTPTAAGMLLLPSGACFIGALLLGAFLMQVRGVPPIATVPFGILMIMAAMWMLSRSTGDSGVDDMTAAILLRGLGLGFLFLSITLIAFGKLADEHIAAGIGLFNTGRQLGGMLGVAALQALIDREAAANVAALGANIGVGVPAVAERLAATTGMLSSQGLDAAAAAATAASLLGRAVTGQSIVIAFDTAFIAIALFFVLAAPLLVGFKIGLARYASVPCTDRRGTDERLAPTRRPSTRQRRGCAAQTAA